MIDWAIVGKRVVCIDTKWVSDYSHNEIFPYIGQVLTIREVCIHDNAVCFRFEEIHNNPVRYWRCDQDEELMFHYYHFKPVKETNIECFESILLKIPKNAKELEYV